MLLAPTRCRGFRRTLKRARQGGVPQGRALKGAHVRDGKWEDLAVGLWGTGDSAARLLALLICRPKAFDRDTLDAMVRDARTPKVHDWLVNYVVKKSPYADELRLAWSADPDPVVASAGWALTTERVAKRADGLDLAGLLDVIEAELKDAPDRLQWAMNHCLAQIGISHEEHQGRALAIGERLEVLKDYPTPPGCTSPFAPTWITEIVHRQERDATA
ncbi:DNA alkylation repair protein [Streptomyces sp. YC537]|uniref:DNA alkylation repair protein n=1 Tax=Streptomyces boluensis TaxID=1775135 RepID=A0A964UWY4_9ACTN|nr:DNA alkylation repair protein [Streptomyces boluensis]